MSRKSPRRRNPDRIDELIEEARERGRDAGETAATWVSADSEEGARRLLQLMRDGDPLIDSYIQAPRWLSGEWAGESVDDILGDLLEELHEEPDGEDAEDDLLNAYEEAANTAFWENAELELMRQAGGARAKATWQAR